MPTAPSSLLSFGYATAHQREAPNRREKSDDYDCCAVCCSVPAAAEAALLRLVVWIRFLPPLISFPFSAFRWLSLFSSYFLTFFPFSSCPFPLLPCPLFHPFPSHLHFSLFPFHSPLLISSFLSLTFPSPSFYIAVLFFGVGCLQCCAFSALTLLVGRQEGHLSISVVSARSRFLELLYRAAYMCVECGHVDNVITSCAQSIQAMHANTSGTRHGSQHNSRDLQCRRCCEAHLCLVIVVGLYNGRGSVSYTHLTLPTIYSV